MGKSLLVSSAVFFSTNTPKTTDIPPAFKNLCSTDRIKEAFQTYASELWTDSHLFSHLIQACIPKKSLFLAKQLHSLVITSGYYFREKFVTNNLLNLYSKMGEIREAVAFFNIMPIRNIMSCNILINGYVQIGDLESANKMFDEMPERNVATWNAMVAGLIQFEFNEDGLFLFGDMHELGFLLDEFTLASVLRGCASVRALYAGRQVHAYVLKNGCECNLVVASSLAHMYMKSGSLREGEKVIEFMPMRIVVAWNTLIAGNAQNGNSEGVLDLYSMMKLSGLRPDKITFASAISSCAELATLFQGQQIHAEAIKAGAYSVRAVISSLISMYSRCGCLEDSMKALLEYECSDEVVWTSMIAAYGFHGRGEEAVKLFELMEQQGLEACDVTFLSLLYACSHCGLKEKGLELFDLMVKKYGLLPRLEHYTCVVDLLGRSGCLNEAEAMIRSMPLKADVVIWKTLLSACKIHKNADMAKGIAEEILSLDPQDSATYVLLSQIHASAKRWQDVSEVRKRMKDRKVKKEPGISWLEMKNQVYQFSMGDKSHPESEEIDLYLKELMEEMKLRGYVPDTATVLHDTDSEEKENSLVNHCEKLAIAFGLMNISLGLPIRVRKNLRVCRDCHVAIKLISELKAEKLLFGILAGFIISKMGNVLAGITAQLGIPDIIHSHGRPIALSELVSALHIDPSKTSCLHRLMRTLVDSGFFTSTEAPSGQRGDETYVLTLSSELLVKENRNCLSPFVLSMLSPDLVTPWHCLGDWFQGSEPTAFKQAHGMAFWEYNNRNREFNCLFNEAMACDSQMMNLVIRDCKPIFEGLDSIVDVGGGTGSLATIISEAFPRMKCTVLEQPKVIANLEGTKNLNYVGGDMFHHIPFSDAVLLKLILHGWSDEDCVRILKKCKEAVSSKGKGGKVIIIDVVIDEKKKDEHELAETKLLFDMMMMIVVGGRERSVKEWERLFLEAGFSHYKVTPLLGLRSVIEVYP